MKSIEGVLPSNPQIKEQVIAKNQPEYLPLPVAFIEYADGVKSLISCYRLTLKERIIILFKGKLWLEQLTGSQYVLQPQRPTIYEPLTKADFEKPKVKLSFKQRYENFGKTFKQ